jgi:hypothetical protein
VEGKVEGNIIVNDQGCMRARKLKMVYRVRRDRKSAAEGKYERCGHGWNEARMLWRGLEEYKN